MEYFALQFENQRVPFSSNNERIIEHDTHVQTSSPKTQSQLDWLETQSTTDLGDVIRKEGRGRKKVMGGDRNEVRILCTRRRTHNRSWDVREATRDMKDMDID